MKKAVGIDIGTYSIKLIELQNKRNKLEIAKCVTNLVTGSDVKSALKLLISSAKLSEKHVNISLSGPWVIVRYIEMLAMKKEELKSAIKFEAEKYIPFDIKDAIVDCTVLDKGLSGSERVLLVAAKKDKVANYIGLFKDLGLDIGVIDVDSFAFLNAFQRIRLESKSEAAFAIINIGAKFSNMNIITKSYAYFTRDILWGGMDITNRIKDTKSISMEDAERLKCNPLEKREEIVNIITPVLEKLVTEIRVSFDYFETHFEKSIERIYISGGCANLFNIVDFLKDGLAVDTLMWDPFEGIGMAESDSDGQIKDPPAQFAVALGLALRGL